MIVLSETNIYRDEKMTLESDIIVCTQKELLNYDFPENVHVIICSRDTAKKINLESFKNLKLIQLQSAGYDGVDINKIKNKEIQIANAGDSYAVAMAESIIHSMLLFGKRLNKNPKNRCFRLFRNYHYIEELDGKSVILCGTGNVGKKVATRLQALGMTVYGYSKQGKIYEGFYKVSSDLDTVLEWTKQCDYFVNILPLSDETIEIVDTRFFSRMKKNCVVIGIGRMGTFKKEDLFDVLKKKKIRGAVLDIFEKIPNPLTNKFRRLSNVVVLPSIAAVSQETNEKLQKLFINNISNVEKDVLPKFLI